jgi:hypothetical protein
MLAFIWRVWETLRKLRIVGILGKIQTGNPQNIYLLSHIHCTAMDLKYTGNSLQMNCLQFWIHQWCSNFIYIRIKSVAHRIKSRGLEKQNYFSIYMYLQSFEMWCWRRMEISWPCCVKNEAVLHKVKEEKNILCTVKQRKANQIGHILYRNCPLKHKIKGTRRWGRRCKQLLENLKEMRRYWTWKRKH